MRARKGLVLDANILIRAVFGKRVREIIERFEGSANFYAPDACFEDACRYIPALCKKQGWDAALPRSILDHVGELVRSVDRSLYKGHMRAARERVKHRDPDDWPIVAVALFLDLPIWTEDPDFFGAGVATWTTRTVEFYLRHAK